MELPRLDSLKPKAEVEIDGDLVRRLLVEQQPDLADETLSPVGEGWDNVTYRIGPKRAARLPRRAAAVPLLLAEQRWLAELTGHLSIETPRPERIGRPSRLFPWPWSIVPWIEGATADVEPLGRGQGRYLAEVLRALHRNAPDDAPANPFRGVPLRARAGLVDERLERLRSLGEDAVDLLRAFWDSGRAAPDAPDRVWIHGDLHPKNTLVRGGRLAAFIDWGDMTGGDRATDLAAAWTLLRSEEERREFWNRYGSDEHLWLRARAWAVLFGVALSASGEGGHEAMGRVILNELLARQQMRYRLLTASSADEAWLDELRRRAYADLFDATWGGWDEARHARQFSESMRRGHVSIIEEAGVRVGMLQVFLQGDAVEVAELQIDPDHQGRGLGSSVLRDVIADASTRGLDVRLSVGSKNRRAIGLYERLGFVTESESDTHRHMRYRPAG